MIVRENETTVQATVKRVAAHADGYGHDVELEILANESANPEDDFLKPKAGDVLTAFAAEATSLEAGAQVRATLGLSGGPFGQRTVHSASVDGKITRLTRRQFSMLGPEPRSPDAYPAICAARSGTE